MSRIRRGIDDTENFYTVEHWETHTPGEMVDQYQKMLEEDFRIQKEMYIKLKDLQMLDLDERDIERLLEEYGLNPQLAGRIIRGEYTPINYSQPRFEKKKKLIENYLEKVEKRTGSIIQLDRDYIFPEREFDELLREYDRKEFFPDGYNPELQGAVTNDKGNVVYDEKGKIKREPTILQKGWEKIKPLVMPGAPADLKSQTPLPSTPGGAWWPRQARPRRLSIG